MHDLGTIIALNKKAQDKFDGKRKDDDQDKPQGGTGGSNIVLYTKNGRSRQISAIRLSGMTDQDREKQGLIPLERERPISVRLPQ